MFAACVFASPLDAVQSCGWLKPTMILDDSIQTFWKSVQFRITPEMSGTDRPSQEILAIAMEAGMIGDLAGWVNDTVSVAMPQVFANEIARRAYVTSISGKFGELMTAVQAGDDTKIKTVIRSMAELDTGGQSQLPIAFDVAEKFDRTVSEGLRSIETFIPDIDKSTGGLERQTLTILAARPSTGKTALAWQMAQQVAYSGKHVIFFSLEMSDVNLWGRAACPKINSTWRDVRAGKLNAEQKQRLIDESYALAMQFEDRLKVVDTPQTTDTIWQQVAQVRPDLVVVDHLRLVKDNSISEVKRLGDITQRLKDIAKNFSCAVLLCAQLNRQSETRGGQDKRPLLADLRDSGQIEENADLVLMMYREECQSDTKPLKSPTEVWVRKFRDGPRDILIRLNFDAKQEWFE